MQFIFPALIASLVLSQGPPTTCISGHLAPRVTKADLAAAVDVIAVRIEQVGSLPYQQCETIMLVEAVEKTESAPWFKVGDRFVQQTHCADANTLLPHEEMWTFSDVPVVGERGRLYIPRYDVTPPGSYYVAERNEPMLAETRLAAADSGYRGCAG